MPDRSRKSDPESGFLGSRRGASSAEAPASADPEEAYEDTWYRSLTAFRSTGVFGDEQEDEPEEEGPQPEPEQEPAALEVVEPGAIAPVIEPRSGVLTPVPHLEGTPGSAQGLQAPARVPPASEEAYIKGSAPKIVSGPTSAPIVADRSTQSEDAVAWRQLCKAPKADRERRIEHLAETNHDQLVRLAIRNAPSLDVEEREMALEIVGRAGGPECLALAIKALKDPEPPVRRVAARALERMRDPSSVKALGKCAEDPDSKVRIEAVCALGMTDHGAVLGYLFRFLADPDPSVRKKANEVLTEWSSPAVAKRLSDVLSSSALRGPASDLLVQMGPSAQGLLVNALMVGDAAAAPAIGKLLAKIAGLDTFKAQLSSPDPEQRLRAVMVLGAIGGPKAVDALLGTLADPDPSIRGRSLTLLGGLADDRAIKAMENSAANDPVVEVADAARDALLRLRQQLSA